MQSSTMVESQTGHDVARLCIWFTKKCRRPCKLVCVPSVCLLLPSQPVSIGTASGQDMRDQSDLSDSGFAAEYSDDSELGAPRGKGLCDRLVDTAEKAADIAVRALGGLVEIAALVSLTINPTTTA